MEKIMEATDDGGVITKVQYDDVTPNEGIIKLLLL